MKVFKTTDKIKIKIHDVEIEISPMNTVNKSEVQSFMLNAAKGDIEAGLQGAKLAIKYALKGLLGCTDAQDNEYCLGLNNGQVSDECIEELLNSEMSNELSLICIQLLNGVPKEFVNPATGEILQGVSLVNPKKAESQK